MKRIYALLTITAIFPLAAFAHSGHGHFGGHHLMHFLSSPVHLVPVLLALGAALYWTVKQYHRTQR